MTTSDPAAGAGSASPALLRVGGGYVVRHQLALAVAAGCRRIICVARSFVPEFAQLQRDAEQHGASFHIVSGPTGLSPLVTAADEVLSIAEGLLPTPGDALPLLSGGQAILVQPAEAGLSAGFERIDLNYAYAGLMLVPGRLVDRLMDMPVDVDPSSALLRLALQAGIAQRGVPESVLAGGHWLLIRNEAEAQAAEERWMARHTAGGPGAPGDWLARQLVRRFGAALLHEGGSIPVGRGLGVALVLMAVSIGWVGYLTVALLLAGAGWLMLRAVELLGRLQCDALGQPARWPWVGTISTVVVDLALVALMALAAPDLPGQLLLERAFPAVMLIGLLRLLPRATSPQAGPWCEDRLTLALLLATLAAGRSLAVGIPALCALLVLLGLLVPRAGTVGEDADITRA
ncbi:MAG TPA: hypothetical protein VI199_15030 [Novosphingobium sp.]